MEEECKDADQVEDGENRRKSLRKRRASQVQQEEVKTVKDFKKRRKVEEDIRNIYLNKDYKEVKPQALETIFETSKKVKNTEVWMSSMKYKRFCKFASYHAVPKDKMKLRKDRARRMKNQFGTKIPTGKISQDLLIDILNCISDEENDPDVKSRLKIQEKKKYALIPYKEEIQSDTNGMELVINNLCSLNMQSPNRDYLEEKVQFVEEDAEIENVPRKARKGRRRSGGIKDHLGIELFRSESKLDKVPEEELSSFHEMPKISKMISSTSEPSDLKAKEPKPVSESPSKLPMFITCSNKKRNAKNQRPPHKQGKRRVSGIQRQLYRSSVLESPEPPSAGSQSPFSLKDIISVPKNPSTAPVSPSRLLATLSINSPKQGSVTSSTVEGENISGAPCLQSDLPHVWSPSHGLLEKKPLVRNVQGPAPEPKLAVPQSRPAAGTSQVQEFTLKTGKAKMKKVQRRRSDIHDINVIRKNCMKELPDVLHHHGKEGSDPSVTEPSVAAPLSQPTIILHQEQQITLKAAVPKRKDIQRRRRQSDIHDIKKTFMAEQQQVLSRVYHQPRTKVSNPPEHPQAATIPISDIDTYAMEGSSNLKIPTSDRSTKDQMKRSGIILISDFKDNNTSPIISGIFHNQASIRKGKLYRHIPEVSSVCKKTL